jgi:hypothetical protein
LRVDFRVRGADEDVLDALATEPLQQVHDLLRAAVEVPAGFDVQYFHFFCSESSAAAIDLANSRG